MKKTFVFVYPSFPFHIELVGKGEDEAGALAGIKAELERYAATQGGRCPLRSFKLGEVLVHLEVDPNELGEWQERHEYGGEESA